MKFSRFIAFVAASFCFAISVSASVTIRQLTEMAEAKHPEYAKLRDDIIKQGNSVLPELDRIYNDKTLNWRPRFAAGVCMEHIQKADVLHEMLHCDWRKVPGFDESGPTLATGYPRGCELIVDAKLVEFGCWFYLLELYGGFLPEAETEDYRLFRGKEDLVLRESIGNIRFFAASIADSIVNHDFSEYPAARTHGIGWPLDHLAVYIRDGTLPQGIKTIYQHCDVSDKVIRSFIYEIKDDETIRQLMMQYPHDVSVQYLLSNQWIRIHSHDTLLQSSGSKTRSSEAQTLAGQTVPTPSLEGQSSQSFFEKNLKRRIFVGETIVIIAVLIGAVLLLFKWRHRS